MIYILSWTKQKAFKKQTTFQATTFHGRQNLRTKTQLKTEI